jgi:hypothetical protein
MHQQMVAAPATNMQGKSCGANHLFVQKCTIPEKAFSELPDGPYKVPISFNVGWHQSTLSDIPSSEKMFKGDKT